MDSQRPQTLKAAFAAAEQQRLALERGTIPFDGSGGAYDAAVAAAIAAYEDCAARIAGLSLFSANEGAEDVATGHLPYLLLPYRLAETVQRQPATGENGLAGRRLVLRRAREAYERFLHQLDGYGLLAAPQAKLLQAYTDDPAHFGTVDRGSSSGGTVTSNTGHRNAPQGVASLVDPAARRNAKIANFQAEKALRGKLEALRQRQAVQRQRRRRREQDDDDDDDDDDRADQEADSGDDEVARSLYLAELAYSAHMAFQGLESLAREDELLAGMTAAGRPGAGPGSGPGQTAGGLGDGRHRQGAAAAAGYTDRVEQLQPGATATLQRLQSAYGSTPTWASAQTTGPLLTADGKPRQPFTIMGSRADMAKAVFRPGHNLPTMSIDEYLDEERRRGGIIEGGGASSGLAPEPDEDNYEKADAETLKARAWDEFTEANPKGAGNTLNRG